MVTKKKKTASEVKFLGEGALGQGAKKPDSNIVKTTSLGDPESFRSSETGRPSGVSLPDGRTFLGVNKQEIESIVKGQQNLFGAPAGTLSPEQASNVRDRRDTSVRLGDIRGDIGLEDENFEEFKKRRIAELEEQGLSDPEIVSFVKKLDQERENFRNSAAGKLIFGDPNDAVEGYEPLPIGGVGTLFGSGARALTKGAAKATVKKTAEKTAKKGVGKLLKEGWGLVAVAAGGLGFGVSNIIDIPNARIDEMEGHAGKIGESSAELINLAKSGRPEQAMRYALESYELLEEFDSETVRLSKLSLQAGVNPEYIDNTRYEYWKSMQEVIATMDEIQRIAANPDEDDLDELQYIQGLNQ